MLAKVHLLLTKLVEGRKGFFSEKEVNAMQQIKDHFKSINVHPNNKTWKHPKDDSNKF